MSYLESIDTLFLDAEKTWRLNDLYRDLALIKGGNKKNSLNSTEKACLRGLLCSAEPAEIARKMNWRVKSLKTELSRTIYQYVKIHTGNTEQRILWHHVSKYLAEEGYKLEAQGSSESLFDSISKENNYFDSFQIISQLENAILHNLTLDSINSISDTSFAKIEEVGDEHFKEGDYQSAMEVYLTLANQYALGHPKILLKIAQIYNCSECYKDSVAMTYFALKYVKCKPGKSKLYHLLAIAFDELCRKNVREESLNQALNAYREASDLSEYLNAVILWNKFDLIMEFINLRHKYYDRYISSAKIAWIEFRNAMHNSESNFIDYREDIILDMEKIFSRGVRDEWLLSELESALSNS